MEIMDKVFTVPKYVLIVWLKICQIPQSLIGRSALLAQMGNLWKRLHQGS